MGLAEDSIVMINIVAKKPYGYSDGDLSIYIPVKSEIEEEISNIPKDEPKVTEFADGSVFSPSTSVYRKIRSFPAVNIGNFYMLWIEEMKEWVGIRYECTGSTWEINVWGGGEDEDAYSSGPYRLNEKCAKLIQQAYGRSDLLLEDILHTEPSKLETIKS